MNREKHKVVKFGKKNRNEGLHSFLRDKLASLRRKTKAYSKSINSLKLYLSLIFVYWELI